MRSARTLCEAAPCTTGSTCRSSLCVRLARTRALGTTERRVIRLYMGNYPESFDSPARLFFSADAISDTALFPYFSSQLFCQCAHLDECRCCYGLQKVLMQKCYAISVCLNPLKIFYILNGVPQFTSIAEKFHVLSRTLDSIRDNFVERDFNSKVDLLMLIRLFQISTKVFFVGIVHS